MKLLQVKNSAYWNEELRVLAAFDIYSSVPSYLFNKKKET